MLSPPLLGSYCVALSEAPTRRIQEKRTVRVCSAPELCNLSRINRTRRNCSIFGSPLIWTASDLRGILRTHSQPQLHLDSCVSLLPTSAHKINNEHVYSRCHHDMLQPGRDRDRFVQHERESYGQADSEKVLGDLFPSVSSR